MFRVSVLKPGPVVHIIVKNNNIVKTSYLLITILLNKSLARSSVSPQASYGYEKDYLM